MMGRGELLGVGCAGEDPSLTLRVMRTKEDPSLTLRAKEELLWVGLWLELFDDRLHLEECQAQPDLPDTDAGIID